ncbi:hypothetical protein JCM3770_004230 [Rhodotorula araucariae]
MFPPSAPAFSHFQPQPQPLGQQYLHQQHPGHGAMGVGIGAGDFELFGRPPPLQPYRPCPPALAPRTAPAGVYPIPIPSSASSTSSQADNDYPPLPDLVADEGASTGSFSPPSPRFAAPVRPALFRVQGDNGGSYRGDRAASVPAPEPPRPMRRKTQESKDWPSFYSSGSSSSSSMSSNAYLPTPQLGQAPMPSAYTDEPASYATPTAVNHGNPFDASNLILSPAAQFPFYQRAPAPPHTDHPLLASEQSDLLDRVRRDLLDVDLSSIKGPLRALALSGAGDREATPLACAYTASTPLRASLPTPPPPRAAAQVAAQQVTPKSALLRSPAAEDALSAATVSPQEAFLDYDEVDSRLHDPLDPLYAAGRDREFGVGVGASLFAPLPSTAASAAAVAAASPSPFPPSPLRERSATPTAAAPAGAPATSSTGAHHARRGPHPFSVPQNAVTWAERRSESGRHLVGGVVDGDADDDDGDFGSSQEQDDDEEDEADARAKDTVRRQAGLGAGFGAFRIQDLDLKPAVVGGPPAGRPSEEERARYGLDAVGKPLFGVPPRTAVTFEDVKLPVGTVAGKTLAHAAAAAAGAPGQFAPPPPPPTPTPPSGMSAFQHELMKQKIAQTQTQTQTAASSGTSTPRRAAAASALAGLNALPELHGHSSRAASASARASAVPSPTGTATADAEASGETWARPARQRKRSRAARAMYGDESDDEAGAGAAGDDLDDDGNESDASYHSSASSFAAGPRGGGGGGPTPKRRRRAPAHGGPSSARAGGGGGGGGAQGSIRCDHLNADGTVCGVVFRRPYDLARHRETIHNESLGGEKLKTVKEWRCNECDGTFSRKDALIRHCRIRGHKAG